MIAKDAAKAEQFVEELSNVYRYLLHSNEQLLILLEEELPFVQSYTHLLATHCGNSFTFKSTIEDHCLAFLIPPLTLQLLVENAVKYNTVSKEQPLQLHISITGYMS